MASLGAIITIGEFDFGDLISGQRNCQNGFHATTLITTPAVNSLLPKATLIRLLQLRSIAIVGQLMAILVARFGLGLDLPLAANFTLISLLALINLLFWYQLRMVSAHPQRLVFAHLLVDIAGLTLLLYLNGGYSNPFSALYLLPLALAATLLPPLQVWVLAGLAVAGYSWNMFFFLPLPHYHGPFGDQFHLHLLGMWFGFVIGAVVIAYFLVGMSRELRRREQVLTHATGVAARREQVAALGALAASTAHNLGTPLSTVQVLVGELLEGCEDGQVEQREALQLIKTQIERCSFALREIRFGADGDVSPDNCLGKDIGPVDIAALLRAAINEWSLFSPQLRVEFDAATAGAEIPSSSLLGSIPSATVETLKRGLVALLDNAADAQASYVKVKYEQRDTELVLQLADDGEGVAEQVIDKIGEPYVTTRGGGRGLGLYLLTYLVDRLGGTLSLNNCSEQGTEARITLPVGDRSPSELGKGE